ncbi:protein of unknown function [Bradyrhizobium vignae]|uniref:Uncharacterized protein n=1 Tax=Bradyrhizobium vignae TaxID=1549949 RepID=A0A2U3PYD0_9BRAD|nr:protein of unknown function [Bradyrhizobium vignae]
MPKERNEEITEISALKEIAWQARCARGFDIGWLVAHDEALGSIYGKSVQKIENHARLWFSTITREAITFNCSVRVKGAVLERINVSPMFSQLARHPLVQKMYIFLLKESPGDSRLVGYDERKITRVVDCFNRFDRAVDPHKFADLKCIFGIYI